MTQWVRTAVSAVTEDGLKPLVELVVLSGYHGFLPQAKDCVKAAHLD